MVGCTPIYFQQINASQKNALLGIKTKGTKKKPIQIRPLKHMYVYKQTTNAWRVQVQHACLLFIMYLLFQIKYLLNPYVIKVLLLWTYPNRLLTRQKCSLFPTQDTVPRTCLCRRDLKVGCIVPDTLIHIRTI